MNERKSNPVPKLLKDWISLSRKRIHGANQSMDSPSNWLLIKSPTDIWSLSLRYQRLIYDRLRIKQKTWTKTTWPRKRSEKPKTTVPSTDPIWHDLYRLVQDRRGKSRNQWLLLLHWALYGRFVIAFYKKAQLKACHSNEQTSALQRANVWRNCSAPRQFGKDLKEWLRLLPQILRYFWSTTANANGATIWWFRDAIYHHKASFVDRRTLTIGRWSLEGLD